MDLPTGKLRNQEDDAKPGTPPAADRSMSKWKLALGAASLFFFVVGVKRSFRTEDGREIRKSDADLLDAQREQARLSNRNGAPAKVPRQPAAGARTDTGARTARTGRLSALLQKAEKESRSREPGGGRNRDRDGSAAPPQPRGSQSPRKRSR